MAWPVFVHLPTQVTVSEDSADGFYVTLPILTSAQTIKQGLKVTLQLYYWVKNCIIFPIKGQKHTPNLNGQLFYDSFISYVIQLCWRLNMTSCLQNYHSLPDLDSVPVFRTFFKIYFCLLLLHSTALFKKGASYIRYTGYIFDQHLQIVNIRNKKKTLQWK